jgi:hypothetical protein
MRDKRFVAAHRGGPLTKDRHHQVMRWARRCSGHVVSLIDGEVETRLITALHVAEQWELEKVTTGEAIKAAVGAIAVANESPDPVTIAVARSIGHAVATAHMADHSTGAADYALKAVKISGKSVEEERRWQDEQLAPDISELILTARQKRKLKI